MKEGNDEGHGGLARSLTRMNLILLGIGAIIGAGIFVLTGSAAAQYAGPAVVLSFIVAGLACGFAGLCYAEFASMIPIAGSAYTYAYSTLGEIVAWIIGWDLILEYLFGAATVAVGWSGYVVSLLNDFGITIPGALCNSTGSHVVLITKEMAASSGGMLTSGWKGIESISETLKTLNIDVNTLQGATGIINLPAVLITLAVTYLLVRGIQESAKFNNFIVYLKVAVILAFILFGISYIHIENWQPFIVPNPNEFGDFDKLHPEAGGFGHYGITGILRAAGVIFFAYIGFDAVSTAAQEAKNPQKDMPWGILGSLAICTIIYIAVGFVMTGMVHYKQLNVSAPIAVAINAAGDGLAWLKYPIKIGAIAGLSSVVLVMLMGQPRVFFSMSRDGLLPPSFSKIHPKFKTPYIPTILCGVIAAVVAGLLPIGLLGELVSIGTLLAFVLVCAGILILRKTNPNIVRPFKTPFYPVVPILGILSCVGVMCFLPTDTWLRLIIWLVIGFIVYFGYGIKHSKIQKMTSQEYQDGINDVN